MMIRSLRLKFLGLTVGISALAILAVALTTTRKTSLELDEYVKTVNQSDLTRIQAQLNLEYRKIKNWSSGQNLLEQMGKVADIHLLLFDQNRKLIGTYPSELSNGEISLNQESLLIVRQKAEGSSLQIELRDPPQLEITDSDGTLVGRLIPLPGGSRQSKRQDQFLSSVNRATALTATLAILVSLLAAFFFSRKILNPVDSLTQAAVAMEKGDLKRRVDVHSDDEIGALAHAFNSMAESISRVEQLRRNMVNDIAHELRSPLTNLRSHVEAMQDGLIEPTGNVLSSLYEEILLLGRLVDDLQDLALAESGQLRLKRTNLPVHEIVEPCVNAFAPKAKEKKIDIRVELEKELPLLFVDGERVRQILRNLLMNALIHTPQEGEIEINASQRNGAIDLTVRDTGAGIPPEHLSNIFERFYRVDGSRTRLTGGAGLGLAIVKQLTKAHGGTVRVESTVGKGTAFTVTLPISR